MTVDKVVLPPFVRILGVDVCIREALEHELDGDDTAKCFPNAALIVYDPQTDYQELRDTIMHEVLHLIDFKLNGKYTIKHSQICSLAAVLPVVLHDNEAFTRWVSSNE